MARAVDELLGLNSLSYRIVLIHVSIIMITLITIILYFRIKSKDSSAFKSKNTSFIIKVLIYAFVLAFLALEVYSRVLIFGTDIGEHTPDVLQILRNGHWLYSYKNPYYDLIDVPAVMRAIIGIIITNDLMAHSLVNALIFNWTLCLSLTLAILIFLEKPLNITRKPIMFLILIIIALSNPYVSMLSNFMGLSFLLALLSLITIMFLENRGEKALITSSLLYLASLLAHGIGMLFFIPLSMYTLYNIRRQGIKRSTIYSLTSYIVITMILVLMLFIYTTAYRGVMSYISEILGFIVRMQTGEVILHEARWEAPVIPRITVISFSLLPSIALGPLALLFTLHILRKIRIPPLKHREKFKHYQDSNDDKHFTYYWAFTISGIILILMAFAFSYFSRSLSREFGYPGVMMLIVPAAYTLNLIIRGCSKRMYLVILLISILVYILGLVTPAKIPWYEDYRPLTICWRSAFQQYYLYSTTISKFHDLTTPLIVYSEDKTALGYVYRLLYDAEIPRELIKVYVMKHLNLDHTGRGLSVVYVAKASLSIAVAFKHS